jgi:hypothetical protein
MGGDLWQIVRSGRCYPQLASPDWDTSIPTGNDLANVQIGTLPAVSGFNTDINCGTPDATGDPSPCSQSNSVITRQTVQQGSGFATLTKGPRELQYVLKLIF